MTTPALRGSEDGLKQHGHERPKNPEHHLSAPWRPLPGGSAKSVRMGNPFGDENAPGQRARGLSRSTGSLRRPLGESIRAGAGAVKKKRLRQPPCSAERGRQSPREGGVRLVRGLRGPEPCLLSIAKPGRRGRALPTAAVTPEKRRQEERRWPWKIFSLDFESLMTVRPSVRAAPKGHEPRAGLPCLMHV